METTNTEEHRLFVSATKRKNLDIHSLPQFLCLCLYVFIALVFSTDTPRSASSYSIPLATIIVGLVVVIGIVVHLIFVMFVR